ncbi:MAG TPA: type IV pilin protein [Rubrivivax sp.]|nr:type IV pilin protein [Rubrivivax sp.]
MKIHLPATAAGRRHRLAGLSLIELMVALAIIAILASVAYPSYQGHIMRTRRAAAAACVTDLSAFMERVYAANLRYDQNNGVATALPAVQCRTDLTGSYAFAFAVNQPTQRTFTVVATPAGKQAEDTACSALSLDQAGTKAITGTSTVAACWR